jgi:hypothetical protein
VGVKNSSGISSAIVIIAGKKRKKKYVSAASANEMEEEAAGGVLQCPLLRTLRRCGCWRLVHLERRLGVGWRWW